MATHLPQNQFISNPSVTPEPPTEGPAVASSDLQPRATAELPSESTLDPATGVDAAAAPDLTDPPVAAAEQIQSSCDGVENRATSDNTKRQERVAGLEVRSATIQRRVSPSGSHEAIPSNEGRSEETPASAPSKNPDAGVLAKCNCEYAHCEDFDRPDCRAKAAGLDPWPDGPTDHIHEIFAGARKLLPPIDIEEIELPLFIRDGDHLRRWEA